MVRRRGFRPALATLLLLSASPGAADDRQLPLLGPHHVELARATDPALQRRLVDAVNADGLRRKLVRTGKLAVGLVDVADLAAPRLALINGDSTLYAASLPKVAILLGAHQQLADGVLTRSGDLDQDLQNMIRVSDNAAATRVLEAVGYREVNAILARYGLYDQVHGGLWVGKPYGRSGVRLPDPVNGVLHAATAFQVCRFYFLAMTGELVDASSSREMLDALRDPGLEHKFACAAHRRAPAAELYRKSGTWQIWHADSVLVWEPEADRQYILVGLVESPEGERILQDLIELAELALGR